MQNAKFKMQNNPSVFAKANPPPFFATGGEKGDGSFAFASLKHNTYNKCAYKAIIWGFMRFLGCSYCGKLTLKCGFKSQFSFVKMFSQNN
jgi:hypothetical protein